MMNGKDAKQYLGQIVEAFDHGRLPRRPRLPGWVRRLALPAAMGLSLGLGGCAAEDPGQAGGAGVSDGKADRWGDEGQATCPGPAEVCDDRADNDIDGFVDCQDYDCLDADACASAVLYAAPSEQECENGEDDDGDGDVDCDDMDCNDNCICFLVDESAAGSPPSDECAADEECASDEICVVGVCIPAPAGGCEDATDCGSCLELEGCGWCAWTESCMEGGYAGPDSGECDWTEWDYYDC